MEDEKTCFILGLCFVARVPTIFLKLSRIEYKECSQNYAMTSGRAPLKGSYHYVGNALIFTIFRTFSWQLGAISTSEQILVQPLQPS